MCRANLAGNGGWTVIRWPTSFREPSTTAPYREPSCQAFLAQASPCMFLALFRLFLLPSVRPLLRPLLLLRCTGGDSGSVADSTTDAALFSWPTLRTVPRAPRLAPAFPRFATAPRLFPLFNTVPSSPPPPPSPSPPPPLSLSPSVVSSLFWDFHHPAELSAATAGRDRRPRRRLVEGTVPRGGETFVGGANGGEEGAGVRAPRLVWFQGKRHARSGRKVGVDLPSIFLKCLVQMAWKAVSLEAYCMDSDERGLMISRRCMRN